MDTIHLTHNISRSITIIPNDFIDHHMARADGEYVKIYLLIQRMSSQNIPIQIEKVADTLELTGKDVLRAVSYWEKEGLLTMTSVMEPEVPLPDKHPVPVPVSHIPEKQTHNASDLQQFISGTELEQLVFMAETYIGHPLSLQELNSLYYISDELHFSSDLLEYLVEYCAEKGKKQLRYMEKVAINWYQQGIDTVPKAKEQSAVYTRNVFPVMKAFGISGRNPGQSEVEYITKWNSMGFGTDVIIEACNRTLLTTHQASFPYANRILEGWKKAGIKSTADIRSHDKEYHARAAKDGTGKTSSSNSFHNFEQRSYDYDDLESRLTGKHRR